MKMRKRVPRETSCNHFALSSFICAMGGFISTTWHCDAPFINICKKLWQSLIKEVYKYLVVLFIRQQFTFIRIKFSPSSLKWCLIHDRKNRSGCQEVTYLTSPGDETVCFFPRSRQIFAQFIIINATISPTNLLQWLSSLTSRILFLMYDHSFLQKRGFSSSFLFLSQLLGYTALVSSIFLCGPSSQDL